MGWLILGFIVALVISMLLCVAAGLAWWTPLLILAIALASYFVALFVIALVFK